MLAVALGWATLITSIAAVCEAVRQQAHAPDPSCVDPLLSIASIRRSLHLRVDFVDVSEWMGHTRR